MSEEARLCAQPCLWCLLAAARLTRACARALVRRLARKAESARQARLRHKQFVTDLQDQATGLRAQISELEVHCTTGPGSATVALKELKSALSADQHEQLVNWCAARATPLTLHARRMPPRPPPEPPEAGAARGRVASR